MRPALAGLFALALASTILAGDGLVLVPHGHAPGQPADHPHGLALYRFPIALLGAPTDAAMPTDVPGRIPAFRPARPLGETLAGASLIVAAALLLAVAPPSMRAARLRLLAPYLGARSWAVVPTGPPRSALLSV